MTEQEQAIWNAAYGAAYARFYVSGGDPKREALYMAINVATCAVEDLQEFRARQEGGKEQGEHG